MPANPTYAHSGYQEANRCSNSREWSASNAQRTCCLHLIQEWSSSKEDASESGMATHHIMKSIPAHVLKALESQQTLVNTTNAETQVGNSGSMHYLQLTVYADMAVNWFCLLDAL